MSINLTKGQKVSLTKDNPSLKKLMVGLGWDINQFDTGADFDLDASAFLLGENGKAPTEREFVFYGNLEHQSGAVKHMGDNRTGAGEGDDEQIFVDLSLVPSNISESPLPSQSTRRRRGGRFRPGGQRLYPHCG